MCADAFMCAEYAELLKVSVGICSVVKIALVSLFFLKSSISVNGVTNAEVGKGMLSEDSSGDHLTVLVFVLEQMAGISSIKFCASVAIAAEVNENVSCSIAIAAEVNEIVANSARFVIMVKSFLGKKIKAQFIIIHISMIAL